MQCEDELVIRAKCTLRANPTLAVGFQDDEDSTAT
jgi:hypothetical protein